MKGNMFVRAVFKVADNVKRLCDGGEIEAKKLNLLLMFNQGTNVCFSTKAHYCKTDVMCRFSSEYEKVSNNLCRPSVVVSMREKSPS